VNSLNRIIRYIFSAILLSGILLLLRFRVVFFQPAARRPVPAPGPVPLFRDPICGTFVSPEISLSARQSGDVQHFCSEQCRRRYLSSERHLARA
jgi:YHS domain-containing protein